MEVREISAALHLPPQSSLATSHYTLPIADGSSSQWHQQEGTKFLILEQRDDRACLLNVVRARGKGYPHRTLNASSRQLSLVLALFIGGNHH